MSGQSKLSGVKELIADAGKYDAILVLGTEVEVGDSDVNGLGSHANVIVLGTHETAIAKAASLAIPVARFHVLSQARTVTVIGTPATWGSGAPLRPVGVPGAGLSPGSSTWSREYGPATAGAASSPAATNAIQERMVL